MKSRTTRGKVDAAGYLYEKLSKYIICLCCVLLQQSNTKHKQPSKRKIGCKIVSEIFAMLFFSIFSAMSIMKAIFFSGVFYSHWAQDCVLSFARNSDNFFCVCLALFFRKTFSLVKCEIVWWKNFSSTTDENHKVVMLSWRKFKYKISLSWKVVWGVQNVVEWDD